MDRQAELFSVLRHLEDTHAVSLSSRASSYLRIYSSVLVRSRVKGIVLLALEAERLRFPLPSAMLVVSIVAFVSLRSFFLLSCIRK